MISPSELRTGNLIYLNLEDHLEVVKIAIIDTIDKTINNNPFSAYEYIPITEEWLIKGGFTRVNSGNYYNLKINLPLAKRCRIEAGFTNNGWHINFWAGSVPVSENKHYVHELQNLYQEIKGEKLTFKGQKRISAFFHKPEVSTQLYEFYTSIKKIQQEN